MVGIIAVDPGGTTGMAWGIYNPRLRDRTSNWNAIVHARGTGYLQIGPKDAYKGYSPADPHVQSLLVTQAVSEKIGDFRARGLAREDIHIACEHFEVRGVAMGANSKTGLSPVFIAGVLYGSLTASGWGQNLTFIRASEHMGYATDDRIKRLAKASRGKAGWIRGKPHARDAWRIFCYKANKV